MAKTLNTNCKREQKVRELMNKASEKTSQSSSLRTAGKYLLQNRL